MFAIGIDVINSDCILLVISLFDGPILFIPFNVSLVLLTKRKVKVVQKLVRRFDSTGANLILLFGAVFLFLLFKLFAVLFPIF